MQPQEFIVSGRIYNDKLNYKILFMKKEGCCLQVFMTSLRIIMIIELVKPGGGRVKKS